MDDNTQTVMMPVSNKRPATGMFNAGPSKKHHADTYTPHGLPMPEQGNGAIPYLQSPAPSPTVRQPPSGVITSLQPHPSLPRRPVVVNDAATSAPMQKFADTTLKTADQISSNICRTLAPLIAACHERSAMHRALEKNKSDYAASSRFWAADKCLHYQNVMVNQEMAMNEQGSKVGQIISALHGEIVDVIYSTMQVHSQLANRCEFLEGQLAEATATINQIGTDRTIMMDRVMAMERSILTIKSDLNKRDEDVDKLFEQRGEVLGRHANAISTITKRLDSQGTYLDACQADNAATDLRLSAIEEFDIDRLKSVPTEIDGHEIKLADQTGRLATVEARDVAAFKNLEKQVADHWNTVNNRQAVTKKALDSLEQPMEELVQNETKHHADLESRHDVLKESMADRCVELESGVDQKLDNMIKKVNATVSSLTGDMKKLQDGQSQVDAITQDLKFKTARIDKDCERLDAKISSTDRSQHDIKIDVQQLRTDAATMRGVLHDGFGDKDGVQRDSLVKRVTATEQSLRLHTSNAEEISNHTKQIAALSTKVLPSQPADTVNLSLADQIVTLAENHKRCLHRHTTTAQALHEFCIVSEFFEGRLLAVETAPPACTVDMMGKAFQKFGMMLGSMSTSANSSDGPIVAMKDKDDCDQKKAMES